MKLTVVRVRAGAHCVFVRCENARLDLRVVQQSKGIVSNISEAVEPTEQQEQD